MKWWKKIKGAAGAAFSSARDIVDKVFAKPYKQLKSPGTSTLEGWLKETLFGEDSPKSPAGRQREENILQRDFASAEALKDRDFQAEQAQIQRDFQQQMADTSYQRAVTDMQAAGINPMLAVSQGGAAMPGGAMPSGSTATGGGSSTKDDLKAMFNIVALVAGSIVSAQRLSQTKELSLAQLASNRDIKLARLALDEKKFKAGSTQRFYKALESSTKFNKVRLL